MNEQKGAPNQGNKQYGAYKVSEYTHGQQNKKSYEVEETGGVPARQSTTSDLEKRLESAANIDFKKKHSLKNN